MLIAIRLLYQRPADQILIDDRRIKVIDALQSHKKSKRNSLV